MATAVLAKDMVALPDMSDAEVPTAFEAIKVVTNKIFVDRKLTRGDGGRTPSYSGYGLNPQHQFRLSERIPGFGKTSDRVWPLHCTPSTTEPFRIAWVNAENGKVIFFLVEKEGKPSNTAIDSDTK